MEINIGALIGLYGGLAAGGGVIFMFRYTSHDGDD